MRTRAGGYRVATHLIDTATGSVVSSSLLDLDSIHQLGPQLVSKVVGWLEGRDVVGEKIGDTGNTQNAEARSYYERGKEFFFRYNLPDQKRAIESFRKAIELDANYAQAHAMLANACQLRAITHPEQPWLNEAEHAADTALSLAPLLPDAHRARAGHLQRQGTIKESLDEYLTAYELDPGNARAAATVGTIFDELGRPDLAVLWLERATQHDTRPVYADNLADAWIALGEYERAEQAYRTAAVFRPDLPAGLLGLGRIALFRGDLTAARKRSDEARHKYPDNPQPLMTAAMIEFFARDFGAAERLYREAADLNRAGCLDFVGSIRFLSALGFLRKISGQETEGQALMLEARALEQSDLKLAPQNARRLYSHAANEAALGETAAAIALLDRALTAGWIDYQSLTLDPRFDSLRQLGAFQEILHRLNDKVQMMRRSRSARELASNNK